MIDTEKLWNKSLASIELDVSKANFKTWFKNTFVLKEELGTVYLGVPNDFVKEWLQTKYHKQILRSLRAEHEGVRNIEYVISSHAQKDEMCQKVGSGIPLPVRELPLPHVTIDKRDNLNPRYTFDSFVIGPFNELAYSAGQAIIKKPGTYNPLFIYGGTGLGKTHLIQAIGNTLKSRHSDLRIFYTSSEKYSNELVASIQSNRLGAFKDRYRKYDVFIMDDIQFLSGKDKTQEELFHLFNILYDRGRQIIFSSDKHPNYVVGLEDRLKSRFGAGMVIDVSKPEFESKVAIIQKKLRENDFMVNDDIVEFVANNVEGSIRELEGILNSLIMQTQLKKRSLTILEVKNLIKNNIKPKKNVSIKDIVRTVAHFYNLDEETIYEKTRRKEIVRSRQVAMYLLREDFNISYPLIGRELGGKDHTTVIHSCIKIKNKMKEDSSLSQELDQIRAILST